MSCQGTNSNYVWEESQVREQPVISCGGGVACQGAASNYLGEKCHVGEQPLITRREECDVREPSVSTWGRSVMSGKNSYYLGRSVT